MKQGSLEKRSTTPAHTTTVASCYAAGLQALEQGNVTAAREWAERCSALPDALRDARCATLHGKIAGALGNFEEAAKHFRTAMQMDPRELGLARQLVEVLQINGQLGEAVKVLENLAGKDPKPDVFIDLGYARLANGDRAGAREALERAAALHPQDKAILFSLAQMYQAVDEPGLAAEILSKNLRSEGVPRVLNELAGLFLRLQRHSDAEESFRALGERDRAAELMAQHGIIWCRIKRTDWRGALEVALDATKLDRYGETTKFLSYAKDRFFSNPLDASKREAELLECLREEMDEYAEVHSSDPIVA